MVGLEQTEGRVLRSSAGAFARKFAAVLLLAFACAFALPVSALAYDGPVQNAYNADSADGSSDNPYKILVTSETDATRPSAFWSGTGVNAASGTTGITPFSVTFEQRDGNTQDGTLESTMTFDMNKNLHEGVPTVGLKFDDTTAVWNLESPTWTYAFRLDPYVSIDTSSDTMRLAFAWHGCFATYFDDWDFAFNAVSLTANRSASEQARVGDTVTLAYYGNYNVNQTSRGTQYNTDFDTTTTTNTASTGTALGDPTGYSVSGVVGSDGFVHFSGDDAIKYGGNYTITVQHAPHYVDYSSYAPYQGSQGATVGGRDGSETFTLTMINPLSLGVTASSGATASDVTVVTDEDSYVADADDGSTPAYYYNMIVNPYDATQNITFSFDFYGPGGNWVSVANNAQYINVYTTPDSSKWSADTCVWSASTDNTQGTNPKRWTSNYTSTIPAGTLQAGQTYYFVVSHGIHTSSSARYLNADVVFQFSTDTTAIPKLGDDSGWMISYNGSQGQAATVTMTTPGASDVLTNFSRGTAYNCWYNVIQSSYVMNASQNITFALALDGGGSKHQSKTSWETYDLPYIKVYRNITYNEATDSAAASVSFSDDDLVASWNSGSGALSFSGTYESGTSVVGTIAPNTLEAGTTYYLVIGSEFSIGGSDGIGKPCVFEFTTAENTANYATYAAQGSTAKMQLTGISGDDDGSILASIVNDTAKNVTENGVTTKYFNRIQSAIPVSDGVSFTYQMSGGGVNWATLDTAGYGKVKVYSDEALTHEVYTCANSDFSGEKPTFTVAIPAGKLTGSTTYYLVFDNLENRTGRGTDAQIVFKFTTAATPTSTVIDKSQLKTSLDAANAVAAAAVVGTEDGDYPQEALDDLKAAITLAQSQYDGDELTTSSMVRRAAQALDAAVETFQSRQVFTVVSIQIAGVPSDITAGDEGTATATVTTSPQSDRYTKVTWSASDNIAIDASTGVWSSTDWGTGWIKATSVSDPDVSAQVDIAIAEPVADYTLSYTYDDATMTATLSGFTCNNKVAIDVVVPQTVENDGKTYTVTAIADGSSLYRSAVFGSQPTLVRSLTLPSTMKTVGGYAFRYMTNLKTVDLGGTETIGVAAFSNSGVTQLFIPDSVTTLQSSALSAMSNLTSVTGMKGLTTLGQYVLSSDPALTSIDIPDNITSIAGYAFAGDTALTSITGMNGVTSLGASAFASLASLSSMTLPANLTEVPQSLFQGDTALATVTVPASVTTIDGYAFYGCTGLKTVYFDTREAGQPTVASTAFGQCSGTVIAGYDSADAVRALVDANSATTANSATGANFTYQNRSYEFTYTVSGGEATLMGVSCIDDALATCDVTIPATARIDGVDYPVTAIGDGAFSQSEDASRFVSVTVPASVKTVGAKAFANLSALKSLTFESVDAAIPTFASDSFTGCDGVSVSGYDAATTVAKLAADNAQATPGANGGTNFAYASLTKSLADLTVSSPDQAYTGSAIEPVVITDGDDALTPGTDYTISYENNTEIGTATWTAKGTGKYAGNVSGSFAIERYLLGYTYDDATMTATVSSYTYKAADMVDVVVPETVVHDGKTYTVTAIAGAVQAYTGVFYDPSLKIQSVTLPSTVTKVGAYAFQGCSKMTSFTAPGVTEYGAAAFMQDASLTSFDLPEQVTSIGSQIFYNCSGLKTVTGMTGLTEIPDGAFSYSGLDAIDIPSNITKLGSNMFYGSTVTSVTGMAGLTEIPAGMFGGCTKLESFTVPDNITTIGRMAFYCASGLKTVVIPASVTTIDGYAFYYTSGLTDVTFLTTSANEPTFGASVFGNCSNVVVHGHDSATAVQTMVTQNQLETPSYLYGSNFTFSSLDTTPAVTEWDVSAAQDGSLMAKYDAGTLSITGTGAMEDFASASAVPWAQYAADITAVSIADGATSIGAHAFEGLGNTALARVAVPASVTTIGAGAFANMDGLAALDLSACTNLATIGAGAFDQDVRGLTIYVPSAEVAALIVPDTAAGTSDGTAGTTQSTTLDAAAGNVTAANTALAIMNGGAFTDDATFAAATLAEPLAKDGYTFVTWTTDAQLMHPATSWQTIADGVTYYAKFTEQSTVTEPVEYPGAEGLDQKITLLDPSALPGTVTKLPNVLYYGETSEHFDNRIQTSYDGSQDIVFAFNMNRGNNANGGNGSYQVSYSLPFISILDADGNTVASYDSGNGALKLFSIVFDGTDGKTTGYTITAMRIGVEANTLPAGTYTLRFGSGLGANNGLSFLGKNVDFQFTVAIPQKYELTYDDSGDTVKITGVKVLVDDAVDVVIPSEIAGKPVTEIAANAFNGTDKVASVEVPASVTTIGDGAFANMPALTTVKDLSQSATAPTFGTGVFSGDTAVDLYGYSAASTVVAQGEADNVTFHSLDDGVHVNGTLVKDGDTVALTKGAPAADVEIWKDGENVTRTYTGYLTNTNAVSHAAATHDGWNSLTAIANGSSDLVIKDDAGTTFATVKLATSGFDSNASTDATTLITPQGNGSTIQLTAVGADKTPAQVKTASYDETRTWFDDYLVNPVDVNDALLTLSIGGPGSAWDVSRWNYDDWKANHLDGELSLLDADGTKVATVGNGLTWITLTTSNTVTIAIDPGIMTPGKTYTFVAGANMTGHNVAATLQKAVHWTFTAAATDIAKATFADISDQVHTGSAIEPAVTATLASPDISLYSTKSGSVVTTPGTTRTLAAGTDYTVSYENNVDVGTATAKVAGAGTFSGTKDLTFTIVAEDLDRAPLKSAIDAANELLASVPAYTADQVKDAAANTAYVDTADATAFSTAIAAAQAAYVDPNLTKAGLTAAEQNLAAAQAAFTAAKKTVAVDTTALSQAIAAGTAAEDGVVTSEDGTDVAPGTVWATPAQKAALDDAIAAAQKTLADPSASQNAVDAATNALATATEEFTANKGTANPVKSVLRNAITAAKAAHDAPEQTTSADGLTQGSTYVDPAAAAALEQAIATAQKTADDTTATQDQIDAATDALNEALTTFNSQVKTVDVDGTALQAAIDAATSDLASTKTSTDGTDVDEDASWTTEEAADALTQAIATATAALSDPARTQATVDQAVSDLAQAQKDFDAAKVPGTKKAEAGTGEGSDGGDTDASGSGDDAGASGSASGSDAQGAGTGVGSVTTGGSSATATTSAGTSTATAAAQTSDPLRVWEVGGALVVVSAAAVTVIAARRRKGSDQA